jgi:hypothetical protein
MQGHPPAQEKPQITQINADIDIPSLKKTLGWRFPRTAHPTEKRQVPFFALLEVNRPSETNLEANNAKGGS